MRLYMFLTYSDKVGIGRQRLVRNEAQASCRSLHHTLRANIDGARTLHHQSRRNAPPEGVKRTLLHRSKAHSYSHYSEVLHMSDTGLRFIKMTHCAIGDNSMPGSSQPSAEAAYLNADQYIWMSRVRPSVLHTGTGRQSDRGWIGRAMPNSSSPRLSSGPSKFSPSHLLSPLLGGAPRSDPE